MKIKSLLTFSLVILLLSCQEDEDPNPNSRMEGRWEQTFEVFNLYESYHILEFKEDGTFHGEMMARDIETNQLIGYRGIFDGSYQVNGNILTFTEEVLLGRDLSDPAVIDDNSFVPKEELIPYSNTSEISYRIVKDFSELNFICPEDDISGCIEFTTYIKVD
ncbi:hypothetical protein [Algoriphagus persicinus]|uniref:hypothetical protein n=1 Tax=Algoriphagus persicinus TaxID=3108754 RepID=UPI002B386A02|nr:hypothetical protein [Algoriphagus sp. E1-3-M2]MEB2786395.1 hypothetical protein [Algoriphagus sp. E1-3-M2]